MDTERQVATLIFPEDAELVSEQDWAVLSNIVENDISPDEHFRVPPGEAKSLLLASLITLYWTMKVVHIALEISRETSHLHGRERAEALLSKVSTKLDDTTPRKVYDSLKEILDHIQPS
jgi:hypothetical protein